MKRWQRYWLYQLPGLAVAAVILVVASHWYSLPPWAAWMLLAAWLVKDAALYPMLRTAFEGSKPTGAASLVDSSATATEDLAPRGYVRIGPELWYAECTSKVSAGTRLRVTGSEGMLLFVTPQGTDIDRQAERKGARR